MLSARTTKRMASSFTRGNVQRDWMVLVSATPHNWQSDSLQGVDGDSTVIGWEVGMSGDDRLVRGC